MQTSKTCLGCRHLIMRSQRICGKEIDEVWCDAFVVDADPVYGDENRLPARVARMQLCGYEGNHWEAVSPEPEPKPDFRVWPGLPTIPTGPMRIKFRSGEEIDYYEGDSPQFNWHHVGGAGDIVAWQPINLEGE